MLGKPGAFQTGTPLPSSTGLLKDLQADIGALKVENEALRTKLKIKSKESVALEKQVKVLTERLNPTVASRLEDLQEKILLVLAEHEQLLEEELSTKIGSSKHVAAYHLVELRKGNLVESVASA